MTEPEPELLCTGVPLPPVGAPEPEPTPEPEPVPDNGPYPPGGCVPEA